jgi:putative drug exporter of the RND superfamily
MERLAAFIVRRKVQVLVLSVVAIALAGVFGAGAVAHLKSGGFDDPNAESTKALETLEGTFKTGEPNLILLVTAKQGTVDDPQAAAEGRALAGRLATEPGVAEVTSYWNGNIPPLRGKDAHRALVLARIEGDPDQVTERVTAIGPRYATDGAAISTAIGGGAEIGRQVTEQVESDLAKAEAIALPLTLVLLVLAFGSVVAGSLPLAVGGIAIVGTLFALRVLAAITDVSIFAINLTTALGLGLAIDYSLFIVSRYREELRNGLDGRDAIVATMRTAGRTVLFSGATVAVSLAVLLVFPLYFLRSFAYAGVAVVAVATFGALIVLPALLALLGRRVDLLSVRRRRPAAEDAPTNGFWHRVATTVMRRPVLVAVPVAAILLVLGAPFLRAQFGLPDDRVLPASASARQVAEDIRTNFAGRDAQALAVVAPSGARVAQADVERYATELSGLDGVERVDAPTGTYAGGSLVARNPAAQRFSAGTAIRFSVVPSVEPYSDAGETLVHEVRGTSAPFATQVAGPSAQLVDTKATLYGRIPLAIALVGLVTFVLLFLMTGSVLIPVKALVMNVLSLSAVYGAMVWIFQDGHLSGLLGFTPTGTINITMPMLMFCIAFGLSMDYEVFLLSRIKEEHDRTGGTVSAVALGLERTGRIVTTAAALIALVFIAFATSSISFIQMLGIGTALAIVVDATLIRALLVPAFMRLAGRANWWAPRPLRWVYDRVGLSESPTTPQPGGAR